MFFDGINSCWLVVDFTSRLTTAESVWPGGNGGCWPMSFWWWPGLMAFLGQLLLPQAMNSIVREFKAIIPASLDKKESRGWQPWHCKCPCPQKRDSYSPSRIVLVNALHLICFISKVQVSLLQSETYSYMIHFKNYARVEAGFQPSPSTHPRQQQ